MARGLVREARVRAERGAPLCGRRPSPHLPRSGDLSPAWALQLVTASTAARVLATTSVMSMDAVGSPAAGGATLAPQATATCTRCGGCQNRGDMLVTPSLRRSIYSGTPRHPECPRPFYARPPGEALPRCILRHFLRAVGRQLMRRFLVSYRWELFLLVATPAAAGLVRILIQAVGTLVPRVVSLSGCSWGQACSVGRGELGHSAAARSLLCACAPLKA